MKGAVAADTIATICRLNNFDTDIILTTGLGPVLEALEVSVTALGAQPAVSIVALVEHVTVLTVFVAAGVFSAHTERQLKVLVRFPETPRITNKDI